MKTKSTTALMVVLVCLAACHKKPVYQFLPDVPEPAVMIAHNPQQPKGNFGMNLKEIKEDFGDCDWMRAFLNNYIVDAVLWLMNRVEKLEKELRQGKPRMEHPLERKW